MSNKTLKDEKNSAYKKINDTLEMSLSENGVVSILEKKTESSGSILRIQHYKSKHPIFMHYRIKNNQMESIDGGSVPETYTSHENIVNLIEKKYMPFEYFEKNVDELVEDYKVHIEPEKEFDFKRIGFGPFF